MGDIGPVRQCFDVLPTADLAAGGSAGLGACEFPNAEDVRTPPVPPVDERPAVPT